LLLTIAVLAGAMFDRGDPGRVGWLHRVANYTTPLCWWGYILFVDAWLWRLQGISLLRGRQWTFCAMLPLSILFWVVFEVYNFHLRNWHYEGLSPAHGERLFHMALSFATILPGVFLTMEVLEALGLFRGLRVAPLRTSRTLSYACILVGVACLVVPLVVERGTARYMFALVWLGFAFLLDPVNHANAAPSLLGELERGSLTRVASLFVAGMVCGFWWESWNWFAATRWRYDAPFTPGIAVFEMPLAGFLGFGPFAWELYAMWHFARVVYRASSGRPARPSRFDARVADDATFPRRGQPGS
jgi:hypothetical protein